MLTFMSQFEFQESDSIPCATPHCNSASRMSLVTMLRRMAPRRDQGPTDSQLVRSQRTCIENQPQRGSGRRAKSTRRGGATHRLIAVDGRGIANDGEALTVLHQCHVVLRRWACNEAEGLSIGRVRLLQRSSGLSSTAEDGLRHLSTQSRHKRKIQPEWGHDHDLGTRGTKHQATHCCGRVPSPSCRSWGMPVHLCPAGSKDLPVGLSIHVLHSLPRLATGSAGLPSRQRPPPPASTRLPPLTESLPSYFCHTLHELPTRPRFPTAP